MLGNGSVKHVPAASNTRNNRRIVGGVCLCTPLSLLGNETRSHRRCHFPCSPCCIRGIVPSVVPRASCSAPVSVGDWLPASVSYVQAGCSLRIQCPCFAGLARLGRLSLGKGRQHTNVDLTPVLQLSGAFLSLWSTP